MYVGFSHNILSRKRDSMVDLLNFILLLQMNSRIFTIEVSKNTIIVSSKQEHNNRFAYMLDLCP